MVRCRAVTGAPSIPHQVGARARGLKESDTMPERKVPFKFNNEDVEAYDVPIEELSAKATEIKLEDGAVIRLQTTVISVLRLEGKKDPDGNQMYAVKSNSHLIVLTNPRERKRMQ